MVHPLPDGAPGKIPGFASGGTTPYSGVFDVGERGRERVFLPAGAYVLNAQRTRAMDIAPALTGD
jgi:SLT domain-containing protein